MLLIVSLPANDAKLAAAAANGGADMLKVHLNVEHRASGAVYGGWRDESAKIKDILSVVNIPVGVMPGADTVAGLDDWENMIQAGISFFDIYANQMPCWMWNLSVKKMPAISEVVPAHLLLSLVKGIGKDGGNADWIEASIQKPEDYGKPLTAMDLANYRFLADAVDTPVIVPTQKKIEPYDVAFLHEAGIGGLMIGAIVTGKSVGSLESACAKYRQAIDAL